MSVNEIYKVVSKCSSEVIFRFVKKMLEDEELGKVSIPSSIADIEKVRSICKTIDNSKKRSHRISGPQEYCIKMLFSEGIICYYDIENEDDIIKAYKDIQIRDNQ